MNLLKDIYIAPYLRTEGSRDESVPIYGEPFKLRTSLNSVSGSVELMEYGERVKRMCKAMPNYDYINKIHEKDKVYLYGASPTGETYNGENANYQVDAVRPQGVKLVVYFEKL